MDKNVILGGTGRYTLGVNNSAPNLSLYGDTGEIPLSIKGFSLMINFWHHLHSLPEGSLAYLALRENVELRTQTGSKQ